MAFLQLSCNICLLNFDSEEDVIEHYCSLPHHIKQSRAEPSSKRICALCQTTYDTLADYSRHLDGDIHKDGLDRFRIEKHASKNRWSNINQTAPVVDSSSSSSGSGAMFVGDRFRVRRVPIDFTRPPPPLIPPRSSRGGGLLPPPPPPPWFPPGLPQTLGFRPDLDYADDSFSDFMLSFQSPPRTIVPYSTNQPPPPTMICPVFPASANNDVDERRPPPPPAGMTKRSLTYPRTNPSLLLSPPRRVIVQSPVSSFEPEIPIDTRNLAQSERLKATTKFRKNYNFKEKERLKTIKQRGSKKKKKSTPIPTPMDKNTKWDQQLKKWVRQEQQQSTSTTPTKKTNREKLEERRKELDKYTRWDKTLMKWVRIQPHEDEQPQRNNYSEENIQSTNNEADKEDVNSKSLPKRNEDRRKDTTNTADKEGNIIEKEQEKQLEADSTTSTEIIESNSTTKRKSANVVSAAALLKRRRLVAKSQQSIADKLLADRLNRYRVVPTTASQNQSNSLATNASSQVEKSVTTISKNIEVASSSSTTTTTAKIKSPGNLNLNISDLSAKINESVRQRARNLFTSCIPSSTSAATTNNNTQRQQSVEVEQSTSTISNGNRDLESVVAAAHATMAKAKNQSSEIDRIRKENRSNRSLKSEHSHDNSDSAGQLSSPAIDGMAPYESSNNQIASTSHNNNSSSSKSSPILSPDGKRAPISALQDLWLICKQEEQIRAERSRLNDEMDRLKSEIQRVWYRSKELEKQAEECALKKKGLLEATEKDKQI